MSGSGFFKGYPSPQNIVTHDQVHFRVHPVPYRQIFEVPEYHFDDILREDHVIDIGANVGAFCIRAARVADRIVAVEPITFDILEENIALNDAKVLVIKGALGVGHPAEMVWDECKVITATLTLKDLIKIAGGCDFLKCDAEGAEWLIRPQDLAGIRRIEMELHFPPIGPPPNPALLEFIADNYLFSLDRLPVHDTLGVMGILHAVLK